MEIGKAKLEKRIRSQKPEIRKMKQEVSRREEIRARCDRVVVNANGVWCTRATRPPTQGRVGPPSLVC